MKKTPAPSLPCCPQGSEYEAFSSLARDTDDVVFFETTSAEAAKAGNISARPPAFTVSTAFHGFQQRSMPSVVWPSVAVWVYVVCAELGRVAVGWPLAWRRLVCGLHQHRCFTLHHICPARQPHAPNFGSRTWLCACTAHPLSLIAEGSNDMQGHPAFQSDASLEQQLAAFLLAEKLPPYIEFSAEAQKQIFGSGVKYQVCAPMEGLVLVCQSEPCRVHCPSWTALLVDGSSMSVCVQRAQCFIIGSRCYIMICISTGVSVLCKAGLACSRTAQAGF